MLPFRFDNTYARELSGLYAPWRPAPAPAPRLLFFNDALAHDLGLDPASPQGAEGAALWSGNALPDGAEPIAQAYAGHQFGGFSPQLGDGRALLLGEVIDVTGQRRDIAFKGSGRTPFSRGGDGKAAVGPMLREVLIGEAMHALGIPTTRALAVAATGEPVIRERPLPGAVLTRVAASHLRVGTFQFVATRGDVDTLRRLADYAIARHDPSLVGAPQRHLGLLRAVSERQATLIAQWMNVGFIHGVMNTDNMTISGETIDYGPCAFMEAYDPAAVFSSIDHGGRYAYANQPLIARWNLARLAETLLPLIATDESGGETAGETTLKTEDESEAAMQRAVEQATEVIDAFPTLYDRALRQGQRCKLGLMPPTRAPALAASHALADATLADDWLGLLQSNTVDHTLAWRHLATAAAGDEAPLRSLFASPTALDAWLARWRERCALDTAQGGGTDHERAAQMRRASPWIIPRNHRVEEALAAASDHDDLAPFHQLLAALRSPFDESADNARYAEPAPGEVTARYQTFCGT